MALPNQELVLEIKQEPTWPDERTSNQGFQTALKEADERASRSPDSQGTENIEMVDLDNESATIEDLGEEWGEDETSNLCDPLCHMTSEALRSPDSSEGGDVVSGGSKRERRTVAPTRRGRGETLKVRQIFQASQRRGLRKRPHRRKMVKDEVPVFFEEEEEEDYSDPCDLHDTPITVPPPRIWHLPRLKSGSLLETSPSQAETSPSGRKKRRPNTVPFLFTPEQEKELAEWYRDNPRFYNKRCREFRLAHVKRRILENKAKEYVDEDGNVCSFLQLSTWMSNMRTYYGKLGNIPNTGFRTPDHKLTEREQWLKEAFSFLSDHIVRIKSRRGVTLGKKVGSPPGSQTGSQAGNQAERISSDAGEDDVHVQATKSEVATIHTRPGTSTGSTTPQGKGDRSGIALTKTKEQMKKSTLDTVDIKTIERVCAKILEKGAVQPTAAPDSPHSAELNDFARTIVSSMRRIPEERWNDVKTDIMLVVRNYSTPAHSKGAAPSAPASATQYPMGYWPPAPPAHAPLYDPNAVPGYNYPSAPGHGYYRPPSAPATGPPMYPPAPPHMHPAPQQGPQFVQPSVPAAVAAAPTSTTAATNTVPSTTATTSATSTSGS